MQALTRTLSTNQEALFELQKLSQQENEFVTPVKAEGVEMWAGSVTGQTWVWASSGFVVVDDVFEWVLLLQGVDSSNRRHTVNKIINELICLYV